MRVDQRLQSFRPLSLDEPGGGVFRTLGIGPTGRQEVKKDAVRHIEIIREDKDLLP